MPERLQRSRRRGYRQPAGAIYVGRPTRWGNPFPVGAQRSQADAVARYRRWVEERPTLVDEARRRLAGHDLVCWCPLDQPCHGDVLIELVNP